MSNKTQDLNAPINFERVMNITAAADDTVVEGQLTKKPAKFAISAYDGGAMNLGGWWNPVVLDLTGLKSEDNIPILADHWSATSNVIGQTENIEITETEIIEKGTLYSNIEEDAAKIVAKAKAGHIWKASIGATPERIEQVEAGAEAIVNGQVFQGPINIAREATLRETSIVVIGASAQTNVNITAKQTPTQEDNMPKVPEGNNVPKTNEPIKATSEPTPTPAVTEPVAPAAQADPIVAIRANASAEIARIAAINALDGDGTIKASAVADGWNVEKAELEILRASRPAAPAVITGTPDGVDAKVIEASMLLSHGVPAKSLEASYKAETLEVASRNRSTSLRGLIQASLAMEGIQAPAINANPTEWLRASFSSTSLSGILSNIANKLLLAPFESDEDFAAVLKVCRAYSLSDLKQNKMYRMLTGKKLPKVPGNGTLELDSLTQSDSSIQAFTHGKVIGITREMIINDDLNAFMSLPEKIGLDAFDQFTDDFVELLETTAVSASFFSSANGNLDSSGAVPDVAGYSLMKQKFGKLVDGKGKKIGARPTMVLVPSALEPAAKTMFASTNLMVTKPKTASATGQSVGNANPFANSYEVVEVAKLASDSNWYGLCNPNRIPALAVGFLNGQQAPFVEDVSSQMDPTQVGRMLRILWDYGFATGDSQGCVAMK